MPIINAVGRFMLRMKDGAERHFMPGRHEVTDEEMQHPDMARYAKLDSDSTDDERSEADRNAVALTMSGVVHNVPQSDVTRVGAADARDLVDHKAVHPAPADVGVAAAPSPPLIEHDEQPEV